MKHLLQAFIFSGFCFFVASSAYSQSYVFAQLQGAPVNTDGWTMTGSAKVGNVLSADNSEVILCNNQPSLSGSIFYNRQLNLSQCNKWRVEFDFRIFDGTSGDGLSFCFLDVPPSNFIGGRGVGIPDNSDGLKIVFDTYKNCTPVNNPTAEVPKIEMRWGPYYNECASFQPTLTNTNGSLSFIRSAAYNHAEITYDAGNVNVYLNGNLYLTGFQQINLIGYLGFTSGTGANYDNHSIKNVIIYTNTPSVEAGNDTTICVGQSVTVGSPANSLYNYQWTPSANLASATDAQPVITGTVPAGIPESKTMYYVTASLADLSGCTNTDSITVTVRNLSSVSVSSSLPGICEGSTPPVFTALPFAAGSSVQYQWLVNGIPAGTDSSAFKPATYANGDAVAVRLMNTGLCPLGADVVSNAIQIPVFPLPVVNAGPSVSMFYGSAVQLHATVSSDVQSFAWTPASGLNDPSSLSPFAKPATTTLYTLTGKNTNGCAASDTVTVKVNYRGITIPTSFTPNADGLNDLFKPSVPPDVQSYRFTVYGRWGQPVFVSSTPGSGWEGSEKGFILESGTYIWTLSCTKNENVQIERNGTVVLIR